MKLQRQLIAALRDQLNGIRTPPPAAGSILWGAFNDLSARRSWNEHGPNPISYSEIEAWCRLTRTPLGPHHIAALVAMDSVLIEHSRERALAQLRGGKGQNNPVLAARGRAPLTAVMFDAMIG